MTRRKKAAPKGETADGFFRRLNAKREIAVSPGQEIKRVPVLSTGVGPLNDALAIGGYPQGRIIEVFGPEASGKTTLALLAFAQAQKLDWPCLYVDAEHALDMAYAKKLGVDTSKFYIAQPDSGEDVFDIVVTAAKAGARFIVVDSVAACTPLAELDEKAEAGKGRMGGHARLMSAGMRQIVHVTAKNNVIVLFINQTRDKIGVVFGNPETTTGGNALKFYATVRLRVGPGGWILEPGSDKKRIGQIVRVNVRKNKCAPPHVETSFPLIWGVGVDNALILFDKALEVGAIKKVKNTFYFGRKKLGVGKTAAQAAIRNSTTLEENLRLTIEDLT